LGEGREGGGDISQSSLSECSFAFIVTQTEVEHTRRTSLKCREQRGRAQGEKGGDKG